MVGNDQAEINVEFDTRLSATPPYGIDWMQDWAYFYDDFLASGVVTGAVGVLGWQVSVSNSADFINIITGVADHPGIVSMRTNASATALAVLLTSAQDFSGHGPFICEWGAKLSGLVVASTDEFAVKMGLMDGGGSTIVDGYWFEYNQSDTSWHAKTRKASSTIDDVDTTVVADTNFHRYRITSDGGGGVEFTIDGANATVLNNSARIPTTADFFGAMASIAKTLGTGNKQLQIDYFALKWGVNR
jgi:hypothetical protein